MSELPRNLLLLFLALVAVMPAAAKKKHEDPLATLSILVVRDENGKPVHNAAVILHPVDENDRQAHAGLELKTNVDGKTSYDGIPYGKIRVQVIAHGFQTYGEDVEINQPSVDLTVKLKRPSGQYSVYEDHSADSGGQAKPPK